MTWAAATCVVGISGANREVTDGVSSVVAAVVLLGVGLWMWRLAFKPRIFLPEPIALFSDQSANHVDF